MWVSAGSEAPGELPTVVAALLAATAATAGSANPTISTSPVAVQGAAVGGPESVRAEIAVEVWRLRIRAFRCCPVRGRTPLPLLLVPEKVRSVAEVAEQGALLRATPQHRVLALPGVREGRGLSDHTTFFLVRGWQPAGVAPGDSAQVVMDLLVAMPKSVLSAAQAGVVVGDRQRSLVTVVRVATQAVAAVAARQRPGLSLRAMAVRAETATCA